MKDPTLETRQDIAYFFEELAMSLKHDTVSEDQAKRMTEFYMKEKYKEEVDRDGDENGYGNDNLQENTLKYLTLGWYIYEVLMRERIE